MQRFAVGIEFNGSQYRGWQTQQAGVISLQETIEKVLSTVANEPISLHGAGRTDAGVHATNMVAHFDTNAVRSIHGWIRGCNPETALANGKAAGLLGLEQEVQSRLLAAR